MASLNEDERIVISRYSTSSEWRVIRHQRWDMTAKAMSSVLMIDGREYVEFQNGGVVIRMIRRMDASKYGIPADATGLWCAPETGGLTDEIESVP